MSDYRSNWLDAMVTKPLINAAAHLAPVLGSAWAVAGEPVIDPPVLLLNFSSWMILDIYDKYKDTPSQLRPAKGIFYTWLGTFFAIAACATYSCGWEVAVCVFRLLWLELLWPTPSIPTYTRKRGFKLMKLKAILGPGKSLFCGVLAGLMDTQASVVHTCIYYPQRCVTPQVTSRAMAYGALYGFVRETVYDARDIEEDNLNSVTTLPTTIGLGGTQMVLALATAVGEILISPGRIQILHVIVRTAFTSGMAAFLLKHSRDNHYASSLYCAVSLVPAAWAQISLARL
ncbi:hypothetical protein GGR57DRAFT_70982 [Xylariaceae sp. FL1272]|nr:hypothetical protein GGR57DRAFT_70982 [Xylariaceae sp. FL1272]